MAHRLALEAEAELDDIWLHIAMGSGSAEVADRFVGTLIDHFKALARNPYIGRRRDTDLRPGLRSFPVDEYVIVYRTDGDDVLILHVVRGGRDLAVLVGRNL
jgi:toxin ParE1/3/4